ncbi:MAG: hypothetical protein E7313_04580 [Clostridiales bacterium]|nr:hypothetical protein [Clostridiales bacterium]
MTEDYNARFAKHIVDTYKQYPKEKESYYSSVRRYGDMASYLGTFIKDIQLSQIVRPMQKSLTEQAVVVPSENAMLWVTDHDAIFNSGDYKSQIYFNLPGTKTNYNGGIVSIRPETSISIFTPEGVFVQRYELQDIVPSKKQFVATTSFYSKETLDLMCRGEWGGSPYTDIQKQTENRASLIAEKAKEKNVMPDAEIKEPVGEVLDFKDLSSGFGSKQLSVYLGEFIGQINSAYVNQEAYLASLKEKLSEQVSFTSSRGK